MNVHLPWASPGGRDDYHGRYGLHVPQSHPQHAGTVPRVVPLHLVGAELCGPWQIGDSLFDSKGADLVGQIVAKAKVRAGRVNFGLGAGRVSVAVRFELWFASKDKGVQLHLPVDFAIADKFSKDALVRRAYTTRRLCQTLSRRPAAQLETATAEHGIPDGWMALDVGPVTRLNHSRVADLGRRWWVGTQCVARIAGHDLCRGYT